MDSPSLSLFLLVRIDTVEGLVAATRDTEAMLELERMRSVTDDLYQDVCESISSFVLTCRSVAYRPPFASTWVPMKTDTG